MRKRLLVCLALIVCGLSVGFLVSHSIPGATAAKAPNPPDVWENDYVYYLQDPPDHYDVQFTATVCICPHGKHAGELALEFVSYKSHYYYVGPRIQNSGLKVGDKVTCWAVHP